MKIHIATYDSNEGKNLKNYNKENCETASELFQNQEGSITNFWCEKGRY